MSRSAAPVGEVTIPMRCGSRGSGFFRAASKSPLRLELGLELLEGELERSLAAGLHPLDPNLISPAGLVDGDVTPGEYRHTVSRLEPEESRGALEHDGGKLRAFVFEREIEVSRRRSLEVRDLALDPEVVEIALEIQLDVAGELGDADDGALAVWKREARFPLHDGRSASVILKRRNVPRPARVLVDLDDDAAHPGIRLRGLELGRHRREEARQGGARLDTDDRVVGAAHAEIGDVGGAFGQHALVRGRHVGMGADDRGDPPIEVPGESLLFRRRFAVQVDEDDLGGVLQLMEGAVDGLKRAVDEGHEDAPLKVDDGDGDSRGRRHHVGAHPGASIGIVDGPEQARLAVQVLEDVAFVPDVVTGREDVDAETEELPGNVRRDAEPGGRVLDVDDDEVVVVPRPQELESRLDDVASGLADHVAGDEDPHLSAVRLLRDDEPRRVMRASEVRMRSILP